MRQTVTILSALMAALMVVSGFIVADGAERLRTIEEQNGVIARLYEQLDEGKAENEALQRALDEIELEREALQKQADEDGLALEEAGAKAGQYELERIKNALELSGVRAENEALTLRLAAVTRERDEAIASAAELEQSLLTAREAMANGGASGDAEETSAAVPDAAPSNPSDAAEDGVQRSDGASAPSSREAADFPAYPFKNRTSLLLK